MEIVVWSRFSWRGNVNEEDIYIIDSKGDSTCFLPPNPGLGEAQMQYCNSAPILLRRVKKLRLTKMKKSKVAIICRDF